MKLKQFIQILVVVVGSMLLAACASATQTEEGTTAEENPIIFFGSGTTVAEPYMVPLLTLGRENLAEQGIDMEFVALTSDEAVVAALDRNRVDIALLSTLGLNRSVSQGLDLQYVLSLQMYNPFVLAGPSEFTSAEDFRGARIGLQSRTSLSVAVSEVLLREQAGLEPGEDYEVVFVPGSDSRAAAMEAGNMDAAVLFRAVASDLEKRTDGQFTIYGGLWDVMPPMPWEGLAVSPEFREDREMVVTFIRAMLDAYDEFYAGDPAAMAALKDEIPEAEPLVAEELAEDFALYQEIELFPRDGDLHQEQYDSIVQFLADIGQLEEDQTVPYEDVVDRSFVEDALGE